MTWTLDGDGAAMLSPNGSSAQMNQAVRLEASRAYCVDVVAYANGPTRLRFNCIRVGDDFASNNTSPVPDFEVAAGWNHLTGTFTAARGEVSLCFLAYGAAVGNPTEILWADRFQVFDTAPNPPPRPDLSWVYRSNGSKVCFNGVYLEGDTCAKLAIYSGPSVLNGAMATESGGAYCWDFAGSPAGTLDFWVNICSACPTGEYCGGRYYYAPAVTGPDRDWLMTNPPTYSGWDGFATYSGGQNGAWGAANPTDNWPYVWATPL